VNYRRKYENFTHLPGESIDAMFQQFTMIVNNMRASVAALSYDDHDRAIKLLHSLDHTVWSEKVKTILELKKYETLTMDELFSKLKSSEVNRAVRAKIENPTDAHSLALISRVRINATFLRDSSISLVLCPY
jgi:prephenate dehydrogenase